MSFHPIQLPKGKKGQIPAEITKRAYEVYSHFYGTNPSLERLNERGGFHLSEIITLLYTGTYPKEEWRLVDRTMCRKFELKGEDAY